MTLRIDRSPAPAAPARPEEPRPSQAPTGRSEAPASAFDGPARSNESLQGGAPRHVAVPSMDAEDLARAATETVTGTASPNAAIQDNSKVESTIHIDQDLDVTKLSASLDIAHTYRGDLVVTLTSPSGKSAVISNRQGGSADDLKGTFDLSAFAGESSKGDWKLTVEDKAKADVGTLKSWGLEITGTPKTPPPPPPGPDSVITKTSQPNAPIADNATVTSTIEVAEDATVDKLQLDLGIQHTYRGDLVVTLTSPSGKSVTVSNREGGSADDLRGAFDLSSAFAGESAKGTWTLEVSDKASRDTGKLESWGLKITPKGDNPPPPPPGEDSDPMTHIRKLASDEMKGRDSPGPDFDKVSAYVRDYAQSYGLKGPNASDPQSPYYQSFDMYSFGPGRGLQGAATSSLDPKSYGAERFSKKFYLDESLGEADLQLLNQRYEESMVAQGLAPARGSGPNGQRTLEELRALAQGAGQTQNVMGLLEGTGPHKDEVLVVMAHLDHVGVDRQGNPYNGADDNASGSATLMAAIPELARLQAEGKLDRSVLFLWTTGEEDGLVGSDYFVNHPIPGLGLKEIAGVVNIDMVGRWDDQRLSVLDTTGSASNFWHGITEQANQQLADPFDRLNHDINQFKSRQDGYSFSRKGEDVLMLFEGLSNPNGGGSLNPDYHGTGDDVDKIERDNGGNKPRRVKDFLVNILHLAANRDAAGSVVWR